MPTVRGHHEGSLFRRSRDGRWVAMVTMHDGRRRSASAATKGEAGTLLRELIRQRDAMTADPTRLRVGPYLRGWADRLADADLAPATKRKHRSIVTVHLAPAFDRRLLVGLTPGDVTAYLDRLALDPQTKRHHRSTLRLALQDAVRDGLLTRNVAALAKVPRMSKPERTYLSLAQVRRIIADGRDDPFWPLWVVILTTGLRVSEALGLHWADVGDRSLRVQGQLVWHGKGRWDIAQPKTARSRRSIQLTPVTLEAFAEQRRRQEADRGVPVIAGLVFTMPDGRPIYAENLRKPRQRMLRSLGLPPVTTHDLRHSAATMMLAAGVPMPVIADILGHSSIRVTMDLYAHIGPAMRQDAADRIAEALR